MANLDGSRTHGATSDIRVAIALSRDPSEYLSLYSLVLSAARSIGINELQLPDFLGIENSSTPYASILASGLESLTEWEIELDTVDEARRLQQALETVSLADTERLLVTRTRIGQQRFANQVLENYSCTCAFCGLSTTDLDPQNRYKLLIASHIKPWRDSTGDERTDPRNGIAACPTHDAAFDQGLLTVAADMSIILSPALEAATSDSPQFAHNFTAPGVRSSLLVPDGAQPPDPSHLEWHRTNILQVA
ncbi:MAG: HNH endonuclease [Pauljensenia sp.]